MEAMILPVIINLSREDPYQFRQFKADLTILNDKRVVGHQPIEDPTSVLKFEFTPDMQKPAKEGGSIYLGPVTLEYNEERIKGTGLLYMGPSETVFNAKGLPHYLHFEVITRTHKAV